MKDKFIKKISILLIFSLVLIYAGLQLYKANYSQVKTETAVYMDASESIKANGFFIRDEILVENDSQGIVVYNVDDAQKVSMGGDIADIYLSTKDAAIRKEISYIDDQIADFKKLNVSADAISVNPSAINKQTLNELKKFIKDSNNAEYSNIKEDKKDILYLLNQRYMIVDKVSSFDSRINQLESKKSELLKESNSKIKSIASPASGYFVSEIDNMESSFNFSNVCSIYPKDLLNENIKKSDTSSNVIGKVIKGLNWYIACVIHPDDALKIRVGDSITMKLQFSSSEKVPCKVAAINQENKDSEAAVILECNYMNKDLALARNDMVYLDINDYSGIMINKRALHENTVKKSVTDENGSESIIEKKVQGVYVLYGNKLQFKQIVPIYYADKYVICDASPQPDQLITNDTVRLYDRIIVGGTNLYDGKVVR